jgi:hypothetical protein
MRCPRQESNLGARFRKPALYPLSYGGEVENPLAGLTSGLHNCCSIH